MTTEPTKVDYGMRFVSLDSGLHEAAALTADSEFFLLGADELIPVTFPTAG